MTKPKRRTSNPSLQPGEDSIDRVKASKLPNGKYSIQWRYRDMSGTLHRRRSEGKTIGEARRRGREKLATLKATSPDGTWDLNSRVTLYMDEVSKAAIEKAHITENSRKRYRLALKQLKDRLDGLTIGQATRIRALEKVLKSIANDHGEESARQARTVWGKYVAQQLMRDEVIHGNPIAGLSLDLTSKTPKPTVDIRSLTQNELQEAIRYLLELDPSKGITKPKRGRWRLDDAIAKRRAAIDLALLQAGTALRQGEALALKWEDLDNGTVNVVTSKTGKGRRVPVLSTRIVEHLEKRRRDFPPDSYIIGAPTDPMKPWQRRGATKESAVLYPKIGRAIGAEDVFDHGRSHLWRKTFSTLTAPSLPAELRALYLGHDEATNKAYYTGDVDMTPVQDAAKHLYD